MSTPSLFGHDIRVPLKSAKQREMARWAMDPMEDYWEERVRGTAGMPGATHVPAQPKWEGTVLVIPFDELQGEVVEDFLYRLEDQFQDMAHHAGDRPAASVAMRLAANIRKGAKTAGVKFNPRRRR